VSDSVRRRVSFRAELQIQCGPASAAPFGFFSKHSFLTIFVIRFTVLLFSCSVRFRSHSLLPRDMADAAFVSSTGDVEE
jgi:hypothetical protein